MNSLLNTFFKMGDKVTKGDPKKIMDWNYYMLWIIFIAFFGVFSGNIYEFYIYHKIANLGWALFGMAIMWFQYNSLKQMYETRKMMNTTVDKPSDNMELESFDEMLKEFNDGYK